MQIKLFQKDLPDDLVINGDIAIDTETMGLNLHRDRLCLVQISSGNDDAYLVQFMNDYNAPNLKKLLGDPSRRKIFHFARFDLAAIEKYLGVRMENIFCTKVASKLVRTYSDLHGLKELCRELLSLQISKQQQSSYWGAQELSKEQMEYAAKDVLYLHKISAILEKRLKDNGRMELAERLFNFLPIRAHLDLIGWNEIDIFAY